MDDGSRWPLPGLVVLLLLFIINGIFYGFAAAVRNISENEIDKKAEEGDPKAKLLKELLEDPVRYVNAIPLIVTICLPLCNVCVPGGKDSVSIYCVYYMDCQNGSQYVRSFNQ